MPYKIKYGSILMVSVNNSLLFSQIGIPCFYSVVSVQAKLIQVNLHLRCYFLSSWQAHSYSSYILNTQTIEGLGAKRAYIAFLANFHFLQDRANFWQTDLFWHEKHCSVIVSVDLHFVLQKKTYAKKLSFPLETFCSTKNKRNLLFC